MVVDKRRKGEVTITVGLRGCSERTNRNGKDRYCAQPATVWRGGRPYCYYHDPEDPKKFGEGYCSHARGYCDKRYHVV